ncbi:MAG: murein biosynthesis integral membrane protein MurJ [Candidatus Bipolaricaulota bacterium]
MKSLARDVLLMAAATGVSRVLGLVRDASIAHGFGASAVYDAFLIAFYIPQFLRQLLAEGALSTAFVPLYAGRRERGAGDADDFASNVLSLLLVLFPIVCAAGIALAPWYVPFLASGFARDKMDLTVRLAQWLFPSIALVGFGAVFMGVLNARGRFFSASFSPVWFNVGMILGALVLAPHWPGPPVFGLAVGVLIGSAAQTLSQLPSLRRSTFRFAFRLAPLHPDVSVLARRMLPAVAVLAVAEINLLVDNKLASYLPDGSIASLQYAMRLFQLPIGVFAVSLATALLPRLATDNVRGDQDHFRRSLGDGLATAALVLVPAAAGLALLGPDILRWLFERGSFMPDDTVRTAGVLVCYAVGLLPYGWVYLASRAAYALGRTGLPLAAAFGSVTTNVALDLLLVGPLGARGLALATAAAGAVNAAVLLVLLRGRISWRHAPLRVGLIAAGTLAMCGAVVAVRAALSSSSPAILVLATTATGLAVYAAFVRVTPLWHLVRAVARPDRAASAS